MARILINVFMSLSSQMIRTFIVVGIAGLFCMLPASSVLAQIVPTDCKPVTVAQIEERISSMTNKENPFGVEITRGSNVYMLASAVCDNDTVNLDEVTNIELIGMLLGYGIGSGGIEGVLSGNSLSNTQGNAVLTSCFNYYGFGSVIPHLSIGLNHVTSGTKLYVSGTIENTNPFPIIDGALYVKIFKKSNDGSEKDINGPEIVDQFFAADNLAIDASSSAPVSFTWNVPVYAESGDYEIATFFTASKKYNLMGLAFTDDVVGPKFPFVIEAQDTGSVSFEKDTVTVGESIHTFASYPKHFSSSEPIEITAVVKNTTDTNARVPIRWRLYKWDQQRRENLLVTKDEEITLHAGEEQTVSLTVTDTNQPVYLLVVELDHKDTHSILDIRFVRDDISGARINFPSVVTFPLEAGKENTLFSCMHSMNMPVTKNSQVVLTLNDKDGNKIHAATYIGDVSGDMMGMKSMFTPRERYDYVELVAQLFTAGVLVEDSRLVYDCKDINPDSCTQDTDGPSALYQKNDVITGLAVVLIILGLGFFVTRSRSEDEDSIQVEEK